MPNPVFAPRLLPLLVAAGLQSLTVHAETPEPLMTIVVEGTPEMLAPVDASENANAMTNDAAELLTRVPGAAVVRNGAQTGIVQLRGLFNERVRVRVARVDRIRARIDFELVARRAGAQSGASS